MLPNTVTAADLRGTTVMTTGNSLLPLQTHFWPWRGEPLLYAKLQLALFMVIYIRESNGSLRSTCLGFPARTAIDGLKPLDAWPRRMTVSMMGIFCLIVLLLGSEIMKYCKIFTRWWGKSRHPEAVDLTIVQLWPRTGWEARGCGVPVYAQSVCDERFFHASVYQT